MKKKKKKNGASALRARLTCVVFLAAAAFCRRTSSSILLIDRRSLLFFLRIAYSNRRTKRSIVRMVVRTPTDLSALASNVRLGSIYKRSMYTPHRRGERSPNFEFTQAGRSLSVHTKITPDPHPPKTPKIHPPPKKTKNKLQGEKKPGPHLNLSRHALLVLAVPFGRLLLTLLQHHLMTNKSKTKQKYNKETHPSILALCPTQHDTTQ